MIGYGNSYFISTILDSGASGNPPVNTVAPAISGTAQEGQTLTCSTGTWTGTPVITYAYQWKRNGSNIGSATNSTYVLVTADVGQSIKCTVTATNGAGSVNADSNTVTPTAALDPDAQAFLTAAGITDATITSAINNLTLSYKSAGLWTKSKAIYPFVGGTSSTHKWNLKDPRDLDAAFRLVFNGGWTHSANGATPNGTNGYADTKLTPSLVLNVNSNSLGYYSGSNLSETDPDPINIGSFNSSTQSFILGKSNSSFLSRVNGNLVSFSTATMKGFFSASKQTSTLTDIYINGSQVATGNSGGTLPNLNTWIGALQIGSGYGFVKNDFRFAYISDGLTDTEAANLYTAVQAFQRTLGRNV